MRWTLILMSLIPLGCTIPAPADPLARVSDSRIDEASGIAASRRHPKLFYIHNDSGDSARIFVVDIAGKTQSVIQMKGATARDYEDIAIAPGARVGLYDIVVADIGDNNHVRSETVLYRFPEPNQPLSEIVEVTPEIYRLRYENGPVDAEALFVHPRTGDGYIFTKRRDGEPSDIYLLAAPWKQNEVNVLQHLGGVRLAGATPFQRFVTAADMSADARRIAFRTYLGGWEWELPIAYATRPNLFVKIFSEEPKWLILPPEQQGESITYTSDARHLVTISEKLPTYLNQVAVTDTLPSAARKHRRHEDNNASETGLDHSPVASDEDTSRQ